LAAASPPCFFELEEVVVRFIGVDVHRDFCEVAVVEDGRLRFAGQVASAPSELEVFACSLAPDDVVAMEATANALATARIVEPHVAQVVLADPKAVKRITGLRAKTDKIDAALLARLLATRFLAEVWTPDEPTRVRRRLISRPMHLVRQRAREKNQVHAVLQRQLKQIRCPPQRSTASAPSPAPGEDDVLHGEGWRTAARCLSRRRTRIGTR
jgi:transposase